MSNTLDLFPFVLSLIFAIVFSIKFINRIAEEKAYCLSKFIAKFYLILFIIFPFILIYDYLISMLVIFYSESHLADIFYDIMKTIYSFINVFCLLYSYLYPLIYDYNINGYFSVGNKLKYAFFKNIKKYFILLILCASAISLILISFGTEKVMDTYGNFFSFFINYLNFIDIFFMYGHVAYFIVGFVINSKRNCCLKSYNKKLLENVKNLENEYKLKMEQCINNVNILLNECEKQNKTNEIEYEQIKKFLLDENVSNLKESKIEKKDLDLKNYKTLIPENILNYRIYKNNYNNLQQKEISITNKKSCNCKFSCFLFIVWVYIVMQEYSLIYYPVTKEPISDEIEMSGFANIPPQYTLLFYLIILFFFTSYCVPLIYSLSHRHFFSYNKIRFKNKSSTLTLLTFAQNLSSSLFPIIYIGSLLVWEIAQNLKIKNEEGVYVRLKIIFNEYFIIPDIKIKSFNLTILIRVLILGFWIVMIFVKEIKFNNTVVFEFDTDDITLFANVKSENLIDAIKFELNTLTDKSTDSENV